MTAIETTRSSIVNNGSISGTAALHEQILWAQIVDQTVSETALEIMSLPGLFYPTDYRDKLLKEGRVEKLNAHIKRGDLYGGYFPEKYFSKTKDSTSSTGFKLLHCTVAEGVKASEALDALKKEAVIECATTTMFVFWESIRRLLKDSGGMEGDGKFDFLFSGGSPTPIVFQRVGEGRYFADNIFHQLVPQKRREKGKSFQEGESYYIYFSMYEDIHPYGEARGFHSICVDEGSDPTFMALGYPKGGAKFEGIKRIFAENYNEPARTLPILPKEMLAKEFSSSARLEAYKQREGSKDHLKAGLLEPEHVALTIDPRILKINRERILQLRNESLEGCAKLLATWQREYRKKYFPEALKEENKASH